MLDVMWTEIISASICFTIGSLWDEDNVRFGYIITALFAAFFMWIGWVQFSYISVVIPIVIFMGIFSFLRAQLRYKYGVFGNAGGMIWKLIAFLIMIQFAIAILNGIGSAGLFTQNTIANQNNQFSGYVLTSSNTVFGIGNSTSNGNIITDAVVAATMGWQALNIIFGIITGFVLMYPTFVNIFGVPSNIAIVIQVGMYIMLALELVMCLWKPFRTVEV
jgi:hypothetical protein